MKNRILLQAVAMAGLAVACSPKLNRPVLDIPQRYSAAAAKESGAEGIRFDWWRAFEDPQLDTLVARALDNNRNLAIAVSRIEQARANLAVTRASYLPSIGLDRSFGGSYNDTHGKLEQSYTFEPTLTWEISLFGAMKNSVRSAKASVLSDEWAAFSTGLSLTAEVATTYFTILQYRHDLDIARRSYELRSESAALIDSMFRYGMTDGVALEQSRSLVLSARADIEQYERSVDQSLKSLNTLLGATYDVLNADSLDVAAGLGSSRLDVPAGLPSDLLYRRPDIMEAYYTMRSAAYQAKVAHAQRLPTISLTASGGVAANTLKNLTTGNPWTWSAVASVVEPIFSFGKLKKQERAAIEAYNQTVYAYEQSFIEALSEVETALGDMQTYRTQTEIYTDYVEANRRIAMMTEAMFRSGMEDYLSVIDAERTYYESQMQLVNLSAQRNIAYVNLVKALGGGWGDEKMPEDEKNLQLRKK